MHGDDLPSDRVPGRALEPSRSRVDDDSSDGTFHGFQIGYLGFFVEEVYIGERETSGGMWAPHHVVARQRGARAAMWCGSLVAPLLVPFGLRVRDGKIGPWVFVLCNSENISCVTFLKPKTAKKTGNWHCACCEWLVPENPIKCYKV